MIPRKRPLAGLRFSYRQSVPLHEPAEDLGSFRVVDTPSGDDQGSAGAAQSSRGRGELAGVRRGAPRNPEAADEEFFGKVTKLRLDVLWKGEGDGAAFGRVGEDAH